MLLMTRSFTLPEDHAMMMMLIVSMTTVNVIVRRGGERPGRRCFVYAFSHSAMQKQYMSVHRDGRRPLDTSDGNEPRRPDRAAAAAKEDRVPAT